MVGLQVRCPSVEPHRETDCGPSRITASYSAPIDSLTRTNSCLPSPSKNLFNFLSFLVMPCHYPFKDCLEFLLPSPHLCSTCPFWREDIRLPGPLVWLHKIILINVPSVSYRRCRKHFLVSDTNTMQLWSLTVTVSAGIPYFTYLY